MADDALIDSRSTQQGKPGQLPAPVAADRGTGEVLYYFRLPTNPALRKAHLKEDLDFHVDVWTILFGPEVKNTEFVKHKRYKKYKWVKSQSHLEGSTFEYVLMKKVIEWIGLVPQVEPVRIRNAAGQAFDDHDGYGEQSKLVARLQESPRDVGQVLHGGIGFDLKDVRLWKSLEADERLATLAELAKIVDILGKIDDAAYVELLGKLPPENRRHRERPPHVDLDKVRKFLQELEELNASTESRARKARLVDYDAAIESASLVGCDKLYFKVRALEREPHVYSDDLVRISERGVKIESPRRIKLQDEIDSILKAKGFKPDTLDKLVSAFEKSFEKRAANFARQKLLSHLRLFEYHVARTNPRAMVRAIRRHRGALLEDIFNAASLHSLDGIAGALTRSQEKYDKLIRQFPLMQYANFWTLFTKSHRGLKGAFSIGHFNILVDETRKSIRDLLGKLKDPSYVWKGDLLVNGALTEFGMYADPRKAEGHNAMLTHIVLRKMEREQKKGVLKNLLLAVVALALSLTGVGVLTAAGIVLSLADVYMMIGDQTEIRRQNLSGFSSHTPPSDFWLLLAVAGAGADVGGLVKLLNAGKGVAIVKSGEALEELLIQANIKSQKTHRAAESLRVIKNDVDEAFLKFGKAAMSPQSISGAFNEGVTAAFHLARLGLSEFRYFLLELSHHKLLRQIPDTADVDVIIRALNADELEFARRMHKLGVTRARKVPAELDELEEATKATGRELNAAKMEASEIWKKRNAPGVSRDPKNKRSPYNKLRGEHHAAMNRRERLQLKLQALKARIRLLQPIGKKKPAAWGQDAEDWVRLITGKNKRRWPSMRSRTTKSVDSVRSVRKGSSGMTELMQCKAIVYPLETDVIEKVSKKIREAEINFNGQNYKDFAKQFNENTIPMSANHYGFKISKNWRDPSMKVYLEIPIVTQGPLDVTAVRSAVDDLFRSKFPANAELNIRTVTEEEITEVLTRAASELAD